MSKEINLAELSKPFDRKLISWRLGATNKKRNNNVATKGIALAYIDARDVMARLDEVCGIGNWQCIHPHANGKTSCRIGIKIEGEWIWKENGAGDSVEAAEKGAFSDSFKRAAVLWGVGRYLYDVPNVWVDVEHEKIKDPNDPRLWKGLEAAEQGIRATPEPEGEPLEPLSGEEFVRLINSVKDCKTTAYLKDTVWPHVLQTLAATSYTDEQKSSLVAAKDKRKIELDTIEKSQEPLAA